MAKVLWLAEYGTLNGGERSLLSVAPHLRNKGWQIHVAAPSETAFASAVRQAGLIQHDFSVAAGGHRQSRELIHDRIQALIDRIQPDLVHANSLSMGRLLGSMMDRISVPTVGHLRDILKLSRRAMLDLTRLTRLVAVSSAVARWYSELGIPSEQMRVIHNGIDPETFRPSPSTGYLHRELGLDGNVSILLSVGQIGMRKGLDITLESLSRLKDLHSHFAWVVIGERHSRKAEALEYEQQLKARAKSPGLGERVFFLGRRNDVASLLNEVTCLIHAARQEPLGRVLLEAAASGIPVIASNVGGTEEIFEAGRDAWLFPEGDVEALSDHLRQVLHDPSARRARAQSAWQVASDRFRAEQSAANQHQLYSQLLGTFPVLDNRCSLPTEPLHRKAHHKTAMLLEKSTGGMENTIKATEN